MKFPELLRWLQKFEELVDFTRDAGGNYGISSKREDALLNSVHFLY